MKNPKNITERTTIVQAIERKGLQAGKIISAYFLDGVKIGSEEAAMKIGKAAKNSAREYKLMAALFAVNRLPDKK